MQWIFCKWNYTRKRQNEDTSISEIKNNWTMCFASQCWFTIILGRCLQTAHFIVRLNFIQWLKNPSNELNQTRSNKRSSVQHCEDWEQFSHSSAGVLKAMPLIMCRHWNLQNDMRYSHSVLRHYGRKEKLKIKKKKQWISKFTYDEMQKTIYGNLNRQPNFPIFGEMALNLKGFITIWESLFTNRKICSERPAFSPWTWALGSEQPVDDLMFDMKKICRMNQMNFLFKNFFFFWFGGVRY